MASDIPFDQRRWQELLLRAPAAVVLFEGAQHIIRWLNPEALRLLDRPVLEELIGLPAETGVPELARHGYIEMLDSVFSSGEPRSAREIPAFVGEAGRRQELFLNFACMPMRGADGAMSGVFAYATDVTDLVKVRKQIEDSERQFRNLAESIPQLTWMAHANGDIFWYNRRWYDYTGTTPEQMEGWGWRSVHDPEILPQVMDQWQKSLSSGEPFDMMFPLRGADGNFRTFLTRIQPVKDLEGKIVRWFGTNTDISEQKRIEDELRRTNRDIEEFSYVASHDLQEPLRMVNIYTQLMVRQVGEGNSELLKYATLVQKSVHRMETLISDLLTFSRTIHSEDANPAQADLSAALGKAMSLLKEGMEAAGARIDCPAKLPAVRGDEDQWAHVFQNLLSNALKYRKNGVQPHIQIDLQREANHCTVTVHDNGIGFEQKYAQSIFGLFKRLHRQDDYPGTGLGLAICKRIVERYGGTIRAEGKAGHGAAFSFSLACMDEEAKL